MSIGIGDALRAAREEQGRTVEDAARDTRVRTDYLRALENDEFSVFGGDVYAKGFLSTYARYLGLDPAPLLEEYRRFVQHDEYDPTALASGTVARQPSGPPPTWIAWSIVAIAVVAGAMLLVNVFGGRAPSPAADGDAPPQPAAASPTPTQTPTTRPSPGPSPQPSPTPTFDGVSLFLAFEEDCWVNVEIDGQTIEQGTISAGETKTYQDDERVTIRFGNPGGVRAELNGQDLGRPGQRGVPVTVTFTPDGAQQA